MDYRGRLAPTPSGYLHRGHAATFWTARVRADQRGGRLILRNDDLDRPRCRPEFVSAIFEDLRWLGLTWEEGPDVGGDRGPYSQSERMVFYRESFERLKASGAIYPCDQSRKDILRALTAPHEGEEEPVYPDTCRPGAVGALDRDAVEDGRARGRVNWRFWVPDGESVSFEDGRLGWRRVIAGQDFGDFVVWRHDGIPSYQLATTVDDALMGVSEVVRGEDLIASTARQLLLYRVLGWEPPSFYHCPLMRDAEGCRLAKRDRSQELRTLRERGIAPETIRTSLETVV